MSSREKLQSTDVKLKPQPKVTGRKKLMMRKKKVVRKTNKLVFDRPYLA